MNEHDGDLGNVDIYYEKGLILTCSVDGNVKIWNQKKKIVREIRFNEEITSALFLNSNADLVVSHGGQLSIISSADYLPEEVPLPSDEEIKSKY